jgi:hypothetical protein
MPPKIPEKREYDINGTRAFNQWNRIHNDVCSYENSLRVGSQPIKYYVNEYNSPQVDPFETYAVVGNLKQFDVRNDYERPIPSRLNPIYQTYVTPYQTTPFLANSAENRTHTNTATELRWGNELKPQKSAVSNSEVDFNRWEPNVSAQTVQNAGQFIGSAAMQPTISRNGEFDPLAQNNVLFANSAISPGGISSRAQMRNFMELQKC